MAGSKRWAARGAVECLDVHQLLALLAVLSDTEPLATLHLQGMFPQEDPLSCT